MKRDANAAAREANSKAGFVVVSLALAIGCGYVWLAGLGEAATTHAHVATPEPWPSSPASCPASDADAKHGLTLAQQARALWQRFRFDPRDGPRAVQRMEQAVDCAHRAGDRAAADSYVQQARGWRKKVQEQIDREDLRLQLAIRHADSEEVLRQVRRVRALCVLAEGEAATASRHWWASLERHARVEGSRGEGEEEGK